MTKIPYFLQTKDVASSVTACRIRPMASYAFPAAIQSRLMTLPARLAAPESPLAQQPRCFAAAKSAFRAPESASKAPESLFAALL